MAFSECFSGLLQKIGNFCDLGTVTHKFWSRLWKGPVLDGCRNQNQTLRLISLTYFRYYPFVFSLNTWVNFGIYHKLFVCFEVFSSKHGHVSKSSGFVVINQHILRDRRRLVNNPRGQTLGQSDSVSYKVIKADWDQAESDTLQSLVIGVKIVRYLKKEV